MGAHQRDWEQNYRDDDLPWDSGRPSSRLVEVLAEHDLGRGRAIELGCGTGTNAVYLAEQGFQVTAVDLSPTAIARARRRAEEAGAEVTFLEADVRRADALRGPCELLFDRGCYHILRRLDLPAYLALVERITRPGTRCLLLAGNADEPMEPGPPTVTAAELCGELEPLFRVDELAAFRFDVTERAPVQPLGWSCLMTRR